MNEERIETIDTELAEDEVMELDYEEGSGNGIGGIVVGLGLAAIAGVTALVIANKDKIKNKITERRIAKLTKQGYYVCLPEDEVTEEDFYEDEINPVEEAAE